MFNWETLLYTIPPMLFALTFHEFAHAWTAYMLGDPTAKQMGRLTLNPLKHLDVVGTILLIFAHFGWAKPVPFNPLYIKGDRRRGTLLIALAGPLSNLLLAYLSGWIVSFILRGWIPFIPWVYQMFSYSIYINLILAAFNIIPVPPLDGSKILGNLLPAKWAPTLYQLEQYGPLLLILLVITGGTDLIFSPIVSFLSKLVAVGTGLA